MHDQDVDKMAFIIESSNYCYQVMSFCLKNAGATYQRPMDKIFEKQIGRNMEVYVDDMVVKCETFDQHFQDFVNTRFCLGNLLN